MSTFDLGWGGGTRLKSLSGCITNIRLRNKHKTNQNQNKMELLTKCV